jgi:hypothetical protein
MKILVVSQYYYPEQFRINDICSSLVRDGHEITVLTGLPNYPTGTVPDEYKWFRRRKETLVGVQVERCLLVGRGITRTRLALNYLSYMLSASFRALFLSDDFDIVFVYQLSPITMAIPAIIYKSMHHTKLLLYCLDLWPESIKTLGFKESGLLTWSR